VNILTFGDVSQGDANNTNSGQATQQDATQVILQDRRSGGGKCDKCPPPKHEPKPCECPPPKNEEPKHEPKPCECPPPKQEEPKHEPKPCECPPPKHEKPKCDPCGKKHGKPKCDPCFRKKHSKRSGQSARQRQANVAEQEQVQIATLNEQANLQNVNILTFDPVSQGDANNSNSGQAAQQENTQVILQRQRV
jgi:hypothetical protein